MRRHHPLVIVILLAVVSLAATCQHPTHPRHDTALSLRTTVVALRALQDGEISLAATGVVPPGEYAPAVGPTPEVCTGHACFKAKMLSVWTAMDAAVSVVERWQPGQPVPKELSEVTVLIRAVLKETVAATRPELQVSVLAIYDSILNIVAIVGGEK